MERSELGLLERVFLRLGAAETDEQLQVTLEKFLVPTILKSGSEFKSVQNKVLEILTHINKRLHSRPKLLLPMTSLLAQFNSSDAPPQAINFSLIYIKHGFQRLTGREKTLLLPELVNSLDNKKTSQQQRSILKLFTSSLLYLELPKDLSKRKELLSLDSRLEKRKLILEFLKFYLLLPYGPVETNLSLSAPAGLSWEWLEALTGGGGEDIEKVKVSILRFLSSEVFSANEVLEHFIIAHADTKHQICDEGDHLLKQFGSSADMEEGKLISHLYSLYQGTVALPGKRPHPLSNAPRDKRSPASLRLKLKLLPYLAKSAYAANTFPASVQVIFDGLFGDISNSKLQILSLQFVQHITAKASGQKLVVMAPVILTGLMKVIGQPPENPKLQVLSYVAIGSLAKCSPSLFAKDTNYLTKIFSSFQKQLPQDLGLAVQECLSMMTVAYRGVKGQSAVLVEAVILENIYSDVVGARLAAVQYASAVFPFHHVPSRYVCMLACGDSKDKVREDGKKGLTPPTNTSDSPMSCDLPDFCSMTQYFYKRATLATKSGSSHVTSAGKLPFPPRILMEGVRFLRACLSASAGVTKEQELTGTFLPVLREYLSGVSSSNNQCLLEYFDLLKQSLGPAGDGDLHAVAMVGLLELVAASPPHTVSSLLTQDYQWIKSFIYSTRVETRDAAAKLFGLLVGDLEETGLIMETVEHVLEDTFDTTYNVQHGGVVSLGHVVAVLMTRVASDDAVGTATPSSEGTKSKALDLIRRSISRLAGLIKTTPTHTSQLSTSSCKSLGVVLRCGPLPLLDGDKRHDSAEKDDDGDGVAMEIEEAATSSETKLNLIECLAEKMHSSNQAKVKEQCALCLGYFSVGDPLFPLKERVMEALFKLKEEKAFELQFTVGEAMATNLAGDLCTVSHDPWSFKADRQSDPPAPPLDDAGDDTGDGGCADEASGDGDVDVMSQSLRNILTNYAVGTSPLVRQASCIWLLSLLKHAGKHPGIQSQIRLIQMVFMDLLTEKSEVTQEVASRGMGVLYELSQGNGRDDLVKMLVETLMEGRKTSSKVSEESMIFKKGELGKDYKGGNISTYKELCSLASDLNKPDLVYKFMSLANHNALWNSRKGAAFGFSSIASHAREQLSPFLPTIIPRLYRYKYDPNPKVQQAMSNIWSAIIPESEKAVEMYLTEIMSDIIVNLNSAMWRNRQSSCLGLSDLLVSRHIGEVAKYIAQLWELVLRARDDIKETVRKAADIACKSLHKVTVRACDGVTMGTSGVKVVEDVLPILLQQGISNPSGEIKAIAIISILEISKNAGSLLKPHISVLVPSLLEALSSLEPQKLNTYSLQFSGENGLQEKLDDLRVAASKGSPMMEIVSLCVPQIGASQLGTLVPRVVEVMKTGIGLGTKVASAQFVISLVHQCLLDLTPYAGKLMTALFHGLADRNISTRKAYAKAIGHLVKVSKETTVTKMITKLRNRYFERDDLTIQSSGAYVFHAVVTYSLDTAKKFSNEILPLVFLAMHAKPREEEDAESFKAIISKWRASWDDITPSMQAGVRVHFTSLIEIVCPALQSQSWLVKTQGAAAIATITESMGAHLAPPHLGTLLTALLDSLQGRTWDGKTVLLTALRTMCKSCTEALINNPEHATQPTVEKIAQVMLSQCRKKDIGYKSVAVDCTGGIIEVLKINVYQDLSEIIYPILKQQDGKDSEEEDDEDRRTSVTARLELKEKAFLALGQAWPLDKDAQSLHYHELITLLSSSLPMNNWKLQVAILSALSVIYKRLVYVSTADELDYICDSTLPAICQCLGDMKFGAVRARSLLSIERIVLYYKDVAELDLPEEARQLLVRALRSLPDEPLKDKAQTIINSLSV